MPDIIIETQGGLGRIILNRPAALNALTLEMIETMAAALDAFEDDANSAAVLVTGAGERGLCAGGDIRALHQARGTDFGEKFFRAEYRLNARIASYAKPYIAIMDGITMGGGVGISAHGAIRIVTERTRLAMPETGIGFFPDVGGTHLLSRAPGEAGTLMALTGEAFGAGDAIYAGLADFYVPSAKLPALIDALAAPGADLYESALSFAEPVPSALAAQEDAIAEVFGHDTLDGIISALRASSAPFAGQALNVLGQKSPTSLKLSLHLLRLARADATLEQTLEREFIAAQGVLRSDEFYEGVRAAIIDKDRRPLWQPAKPAEVTDAILDAYFAPVPHGLF